MTVRIQLSDKRDQAILLVDISADTVEQAEAEFAAAAGLTGLGPSYESFGTPPAATIPSITQLTRPQAPAASEPWGQPPVPAYQPAAAAPVAAPGAPGPAPVCQHGTKLYKTGTSAANGRQWSAWFCPSPGNDPTQCAKQWLR